MPGGGAGTDYLIGLSFCCFSSKRKRLRGSFCRPLLARHLRFLPFFYLLSSVPSTRRSFLAEVAAAREGEPTGSKAESSKGGGGGGGGSSSAGGGGVKKGFFDAPAAKKAGGGMKKGFFDAPRPKPKPKAEKEEEMVFLKGKASTTASGKSIPDFMKVDVDDQRKLHAEVNRRKLEIETLKWTTSRVQPNGVRDRKEDAPQQQAITISWAGGDVDVSADGA